MLTMEENNKEVRQHRVKSDYGSGDYYKHFVKTTGNTNITQGEFGEILREFNGHVRDRISKKGAEYFFPFRIGKIELRKLMLMMKHLELY